MSSYYGKRVYNYPYSHNQLSADNPFRYLGSTINPYQPKISNQPSQQYEVTTDKNSQTNKPPTPYERNTIKKDNINENKPWTRTNSNSSLINNSYNILNNIPYSKKDNFSQSFKSQQRDHVAELLNYTNRELPNYESIYRDRNKNIDQNNKNENNNQIPVNSYNNINSSRIPPSNLLQKDSSSISKNDNFNNIDNKNQNVNNLSSLNNNKTQDRIFSPTKNLNDNFIKNEKSKNNYDRGINYLFNSDNKNNNERENKNKNIFNSNNKIISNEEKLSNIELSEYSDENCNSIKSFAYKENQNSTFRNYMEDKSRAIQNLKGDPNSSLFCLFDGHGGGEVSKYLQSNFYTYFKEMLPFDNVNENLKTLFNKVDNKIKESNYFNIGATACIIYITKENGQKCLYSANIGDTRSLLIKTNDFMRLSYDHRASDENEYKRIINNGGIVFAGRVYGTLMLSRAFGDWELKSYGVSNEPHITRINITDSDKYVIMASDGVWDVLEDIDVFNMSKNFDNPKELCNNIVQRAIEKGSMDNISCFVIKLK